MALHTSVPDGYSVFETWLKQRLKQPLPGWEGQRQMLPSATRYQPGEIPATARKSAVMVLLYPVRSEWCLLLIRRAEDGKAHSGQIGFPGGKQEENDRSLVDTALRETMEEVGILPRAISLTGALTPIYISVSGFQVFPYIGMLPHQPEISPNPAEVAAVLEYPLELLLSPERKATAAVPIAHMPGVVRRVKAYHLGENEIVWGATAMILAELEMILAEKGSFLS